MKPQIQKKKKEKKKEEREWRNCGNTNTNIFQKKISHEGTKTFLDKKIMGRLFQIGGLMIRPC